VRALLSPYLSRIFKAIIFFYVNLDRGPNQCEVLLTLLFSFLLYPTRVFLNRGNHEDISLNLNINFDPNFKKDCMLKFNKYGMIFFNQCQRLFRRLPLATVIENKIGFRLFVCHGGLSDRVDLNYLACHLNRFQFASVTYSGNKIAEQQPSASDERKRRAIEQLSDLLWSDPITTNQSLTTTKGCYPNTNRNIGKLFGEDVSAAFCKKYNFNAIIRSHQVRANGICHNDCLSFFIFF
jgi:hypothetical protein